MITRISRGCTWVELGGIEYCVDGEPQSDTEIWMFPRSVSMSGPDGYAQIIKDDKLRTQIITAAIAGLKDRGIKTLFSE